MEWGGLLIQALMLGGFLIWEGYFKQKGKNIAIKDDARDISYEEEKGKQLATQEELEKVTKLAENIKSEIDNISYKKQDKFIQFKEAVIDFNLNTYILVEYNIKDISIVHTISPDSGKIRNKLSELYLKFGEASHLLGKISIYSEREDEEWVSKMYQAFNKITPLYKLTAEMFDTCALEADNISKFKSDNVDSIHIYKDFNKTIKEFILERDKIEKDAYRAICEIGHLTKVILNAKYNA